MPPLLDTINGEVAMAWAGREVPWHKLGTQMPEGCNDSEQAIVASHNDWEALKVPVFTKYNGLELEVLGRYAVVRNVDGRVIGEVGKSYEILQPLQAFKGIDAWAKDDRVQYESVGLLDGGRKLFILARLGEVFKVGGKDPIYPYVLLYNSYDGTSGLVVQLTNVRVVCTNTCTAALQGHTPKVHIRHTRSIHQRLEESAKALGIVSATQHAMHEAFERMAQTKADERTLEKVASIILPDPGEDASDIKRERYQKERLQLWNLLQSKTVQFAGGSDNRWGLFNWGTEWIDWEENRKGSILEVDKDALERRAKYTIGLGGSDFGAGIRQQVFDALVV